MNFSEGVKTPLPSKFITLQFASLSKGGAKIVQSRGICIIAKMHILSLKIVYGFETKRHVHHQEKWSRNMEFDLR